jgi:Na+/melibiose symporter-like transporter
MLFAILVWFPPVHGTSIWNVVWLGFTLSGTWFFYTYVVAPYLALMPEISSNPEERVSLTVTMAYFEAGAILIASLAVPPVIEMLRGGLQVGPVFLADGFKVTAIALALIGGIGFFVSISKVKETNLDTEKHSKLNLRQSIIECFRNPAFPPYLLAVSSAKIAIGLVMISMPFLATAVLHKGEGFTAALLAPMFLSTLVGFVLAEKFVNRTGLKYAFRSSTLLASLVVLGFLALLFVGGGTRSLTKIESLDSGDQVFVFVSKGQSVPAVDTTKAADPGTPFWTQEDAAFVRLTPLQWRGFFFSADLDDFRSQALSWDNAAVTRCLRPDKESSRPSGAGKDWLVTQEVQELAVHLTRECGEQFLFREPKRRFEEAVYLQQVSLPEIRQDSLTIPVHLGSIPEPPETFNLQGWTTLWSTPEQRSAMTGPAAAKLGPAHPFLFEGRILFSDGTMVFDHFTLKEGDIRALKTDPAGDVALAQLESIFPEPARLNHFLGRFDFRMEYQLSARIYLVLFLCFLLGFPAAVLMSMYRPIVCDIIDLDEKRVGTRREAIYFGVEGLLTKGADGVAAVVAPAVMLLGHLLFAPPIGYVLPFGAAAVFMILAFWIFGKYPLGEKPRQEP